MKTDYSDEIRELLSENFEPVASGIYIGEHTEKLTLNEVHAEITNILPKEWVAKSDVYEALKELGFKSFLHTYPAAHDNEGKEIFPERNVLLYLLDKKTASL